MIASSSLATAPFILKSLFWMFSNSSSVMCSFWFYYFSWNKFRITLLLLLLFADPSSLFLLFSRAETGFDCFVDDRYDFEVALFVLVTGILSWGFFRSLTLIEEMFFFNYLILLEPVFFYFFPPFFLDGSVYFLLSRFILILFSSASFFSSSPITFMGDLLLLIIADLLLLPSPSPLRYCNLSCFCVWLNWLSEFPEGEDSIDLFLAEVLFLQLYFFGLDFFSYRLLSLFDWCFA